MEDLEKPDDFTLIKLYIKGQKVQKHNVFVKYSTDFNRKVLNEFDYEIDKEWNLRLSTNQRIYDDKKFRFHSLGFTGVDVHFNFGLTSYKEFIGTNCNENSKWLQEKGQNDFEDCNSYLASPIGVGSLIQTSDGQFVFIRRSSFCAEGAGLIDRPGGHPEPQHLCKVLGCELNDLFDAPDSAFTDELFDSVIREIVDEINIPREELDEPQLIGIVCNNLTAGRPSAEFFVRCSLPALMVKSLYSQGSQAEAEESTELLFMTEKALKNLTGNEDVWNMLTPSSQGCIRMFQELRQQLRKDSLTKEDIDRIRNTFNSLKDCPSNLAENE